MKQLLIVLLLFPITNHASELVVEIEKKAAKLSACSIKQPCTIAVEKIREIYVVKVRKSAKVTDYGVLRYKTGSTTYHRFDNKGAYIDSRHTT